MTVATLDVPVGAPGVALLDEWHGVDMIGASSGIGLDAAILDTDGNGDRRLLGIRFSGKKFSLQIGFIRQGLFVRVYSSEVYSSNRRDWYFGKIAVLRVEGQLALSSICNDLLAGSPLLKR